MKCGGIDLIQHQETLSKSSKFGLCLSVDASDSLQTVLNILLTKYYAAIKLISIVLYHWQSHAYKGARFVHVLYMYSVHYRQ